MTPSFAQRKTQLLEMLNSDNQEQLYEKLISLGRQLPKLTDHAKISENKIKGCQTLMYLSTRFEGDLLFFDASCDALISAGLAAVAIFLFSGLSAQQILQSDATFVQEIGLDSSLSPSRLNGLSSILQRIKQDALKAYIKNQHVI